MILKRFKWLTGVAFSLILVFGLAFSAIMGASNSRVAAHTQQDCDNNAVIPCGIDHHVSVADQINELKRKYRENHNGNVQAVYTAFGISSESALDNMVAGSVTGRNEVFVGDRMVASNATTAGRQNISNERGSSVDMGGGTFWQRPPSVSFADPSGSLVALVKMENNVFKFAVILSCGNPVGATPVTTPPPPPAEAVPNLEVTKQVRVHGQTQWTTAASAKPGDRLEFRIVVRNTGQTDLTELNVRDTLPSGTSLEAGSLASNISESDLFHGSGYAGGTLARGQQREITFRVVMTSMTNVVDTCISSRFRNVAYARARNVMEKTAEASVEVVCQPVVAPPATVTTTPPATPPVVLAASVTPVASKAATLPDTGIGNIVGMFAAVSISGGMAHRLVWSRFRH